MRPDAAAARGPLEILSLGTRDYAEVLALQRGLAAERAAGARPDALLLVEHPHVVTRGRGANGFTLRETPHPVFDVERGGDVTYHGPGQLVGYPVVHLAERGLRVGPYLRLLEDLLIEACGALGARAWRVKGFTGVWTAGGKLASIGIAARSWVAYHGFALNVSTDLSQFRGLYPCGLEPGRMTSLERVLGRQVPMDEAMRAVVHAFKRELGAAGGVP